MLLRANGGVRSPMRTQAVTKPSLFESSNSWHLERQCPRGAEWGGGALSMEGTACVLLQALLPARELIAPRISARFP